MRRGSDGKGTMVRLKVKEKGEAEWRLRMWRGRDTDVLFERVARDGTTGIIA